MLVAKWKPGFASLYKGANAQLVAEEVQSLIDKNGSATPDAILDKARDASTELHKCFTWHDHVAAEKWRMQEARTLIRHLVVEVKDEAKPDTTTTVRLFHKVDTSWDAGYKPIQHIVRNIDEYQSLLNNAKRELVAFRKKYERLSELEPIFDLIDELTE